MLVCLMSLQLQGQMQFSCRTLAIIKPDAVAHIGEIVGSIEKAGFVIR
jgi:Nucleoside diphosphate kinase